MDHLCQLDNSNFPEFPMKNSSQTGPSENNYCFKGIISDGKTYHSCTFPNCGKIFRYQSEVKRHMLAHSLQRPVSCPFPDCGKKFKHEEALKGHIRTHTGETPYTCEEPECGQSFLNKGALIYHRLKHKGEKEYKCSFPGCGRSFWTMVQLRQHAGAQIYHQKISNSILFRENQARMKIRKYNESSDKDSVGSQIKIEKELQEKNINKREIIPIESVNDDLQEQHFERIIKLILNENDAIKTKLAMYEKLKWLNEENEGMDDKFRVFSEAEEQRQYSTQEFSEEKIFQFLKFND